MEAIFAYDFIRLTTSAIRFAGSNESCHSSCAVLSGLQRCVMRSCVFFFLRQRNERFALKIQDNIVRSPSARRQRPSRKNIRQLTRDDCIVLPKHIRRAVTCELPVSPRKEIVRPAL